MLLFNLGYYRTGYHTKPYSIKEDDLLDRLMHITHHIPKYEENHWVNPSEDDGEEIDGSCGTLKKWFRDILPQNLIDSESTKTADDVWESIQLVLGRLILSAYPKLSCQRAPTAGDHEIMPCDTTGFQFTADLVIDDSGKVFIMEIHTHLGLKSHGLGDPESGFWRMISKAAKQGTWGSVAMLFAGHLGDGLLRDMFTDVISNVPSYTHPFKFDIRQALLSSLIEEYYACNFDVDAVLPAKLFDYKLLARGELSLPYDLGLFYSMYEEVRGALRDVFNARECGYVDFNSGLSWE